MLRRAVRRPSAAATASENSRHTAHCTRGKLRRAQVRGVLRWKNRNQHGVATCHGAPRVVANATGGIVVLHGQCALCRASCLYTVHSASDGPFSVGRTHAEVSVIDGSVYTSAIVHSLGRLQYDIRLSCRLSACFLPCSSSVLSADVQCVIPSLCRRPEHSTWQKSSKASRDVYKSR